MKFDLRSFFANPGPPPAPAFGAALDGPMGADHKASIRRPMIAGLVVIFVCVFGLGLWASFSPIWSAVSAPGQVRVEANRKTLKSREGGVVRAINVREGQSVAAGALLIQLDDTVARAQVDVLTNQYDVALMQRARFLAETTGQRSIQVPAELASRSGDPRIATTISSETLLFTSRVAAIEGQKAILEQRFEQLQTARSGLDVQVRSIDEQVGFISDELQGYQTLYERGFAPRTLILRYQRQLAEINGRRGALVAEITRNQQAAGETRLQLAQLYEQRRSEAATGLRDADARLADLTPRLTAARDSLDQTQVRSPENGYVLNLTQFTVGGVAAPNEPLMDIVPANTPLVVHVQVRPSDIDEVRVGLDAQVTLAAFQSQKVPKLVGQVIGVSADSIVNPENNSSYYTADIRIPREELDKLPEGARLYPGMPAVANIRTGRRTIMSYLLGPIGSVVGNSMLEQ